MVPIPAPQAVVRASPGLVSSVGALRYTLTSVTPEFATYDFESERDASPLLCARCGLRTTQMYETEREGLCRACYELAERTTSDA